MWNERRLTPFEHYMLADDRPEYPMRFCFRLVFAGSLDLPRLNAAFALATGDHPLLNARVKRDLGTWSWTMSPEPAQASEWAWSFDLTRESGIRFLLEQGSDNCTLWLQVHHSCTDARGAIQFLASWFGYYDGSESPLPESPAEDLASKMRQRDIGRDRRLWTYALPCGKYWNRLYAFCGRRPVVVKEHKAVHVPSKTKQNDIRSKPCCDRPAFLSRRLPFNPEEWREGKKQAQSTATVNDLLLMAVFIAVGKWNNRHSSPGAPWIRLAVPIDLATESNRRKLAANYCSMVFLDRANDDEPSYTELLHGIQREMNWIRQETISYGMMDVLRILDRLPCGMSAGVKATSCLTSVATAVVSNLGMLDSMIPHGHELSLGNANLTEFDFLVPFRPGTSIALGVVTYANQLHITMNYDVRCMSSPIASAFFELLCRVVNDSLHDSAFVGT